MEEERQDILRKHAKDFANQAVQEMVAEEKAIELTYDEMRMLKSYRSYRQRNIKGVFSWQLPPQDPTEIAIPEEPSLIVDPRDVSE
jgi:hypothetical protein